MLVVKRIRLVISGRACSVLIWVVHKDMQDSSCHGRRRGRFDRFDSPGASKKWSGWSTAVLKCVIVVFFFLLVGIDYLEDSCGMFLVETQLVGESTV
jgi:hypothetical protein